VKTPPRAVGLVKVASFRNYAANEQAAEFDRIARSWDTASTQAAREGASETHASTTDPDARLYRKGI